MKLDSLLIEKIPTKRFQVKSVGELKYNYLLYTNYWISFVDLKKINDNSDKSGVSLSVAIPSHLISGKKKSGVDGYEQIIFETFKSFKKDFKRFLRIRVIDFSTVFHVQNATKIGGVECDLFSLVVIIYSCPDNLYDIERMRDVIENGLRLRLIKNLSDPNPLRYKYI